MSEEIRLPRSALGDVTNLVGKRGFSSISTSDYKKGEGIQIAKKECLRVDGNCKEKTAECISGPHLLSEIISNVLCEIKEPCLPTVRENATSTTVKADVGGDVSESTKLIPSDENGPHVVEEEEDDRTDFAALPQAETMTVVENKVGMDDGTDTSLDNVDSSKEEYIDGSRFFESQESRCGLERCVGQKGDGFSNACMDMIKTCSCSFCTKAACLWTDLHYQDIKGRIDAIKKSQKEASILVHRQNNRDSASNFEKLSNLESDLTGRWKSLFVQMEDIFAREGTQLETSLATLKKLMMEAGGGGCCCRRREAVGVRCDGGGLEVGFGEKSVKGKRR